ncbi:membrane dipeptidase, partial [Escherichia coli]|uniref:membrane dipeptidase n=1 Tax=Escherichia coli TaxID=562 RepID=UPI002739E09C
HSPRNVPDDVLALVAKNGGVVMVNFYPGYVSEAVRTWNADQAAEGARLKALNPGDPAAVAAGLERWKAAHPEPKATLAQVADHADYVRKLA